VRTILKLHLSIAADLPEPNTSAEISTFKSADADEWLALNNEIFIVHPDQGDWVMQDLTNRMNESWFDADGFFLARNNGQIIGFCWTKIHHDRVNEGPIGEIYVLGVNPTAHSSGLGKALLLTALRYFQSKEIKESMLYVDADNHSALILYKKLGFN
jgi:mycothiol synthase